MARRFLDEEQNKLRKRNNAASSIARNITATAKQVKTQQRPVQRRTMNISKATVSAPKTQAKAQKSTQITQPKKQRNYNQNTWSPVTDPLTEYFSPAPEKPKKVKTPEQQRRDKIMNDALDTVRPAYHTGYDNDITLQNTAASFGKGVAQGTQNVAINAPAMALKASTESWRDYTPDEAHNFVELSPEFRERLAQTADKNAQALWDSALNQSLDKRIDELSNPLDGTFVGGVMEGTGNMIPSMAASYATGGLGLADSAAAANMATMLANVFGGSAKEAYDNGADAGRAVRYGGAKAAIEGLTEMINPYMPGTFAQVPGAEDFYGEAAEEFIGQYLEPLANLFLQDDQSLAGYGRGLQDVLYQDFGIGDREAWDNFLRTGDYNYLNGATFADSQLANTLKEAGQAGLSAIGTTALLGGAQGIANRAMSTQIEAQDSNFKDSVAEGLRTELEKSGADPDYAATIAQTWRGVADENYAEAQGLLRDIAAREGLETADAQRIARGSDVEVVDSNQNVVNLSRSLFDSIKSLAKNAFEGTVARPLNSQIDEAISHFDGGVTKDYNAENYVTVDLSPDLGYAKVDGPVLLSEGVIKKTLEDKHYNYVSKENLYNLDKSLRESILAIEGTGKNEGHVSFVINDVSNTGHPLLVAVARKTIRGRDVFEVNNIRSIHEKENIYRAIAAGSRVYLNERSTDFLTSLRLQLPSSGDIGASIPILAQEYLDVNKPKKKDVKQLTDAYFAAHKPQFEQVQLDLDAGNTEAAQNTAAEIAQDSINETLADLEQDDILETLKSQEMMDVVSKLFFNGSNEVITPQEIGEIYNRDQVGKAYDQVQGRTNEIGGPADIARIWNEYQNQQTAEPAGDQSSSNDGTGQTSETVIPELIEPEERLNRTARRRAKGEGAGVYQNVSEETAQRTNAQVKDRASNVTYTKTNLNDMASGGYARLDAMGIDGLYDRFVNYAPTTLDTKNPFSLAMNKIQNDLALHSAIVDGQVVLQTLDSMHDDLISEANGKGINFETYTTPDGLYRSRLLNTEATAEANDYLNRLNDLNEKIDQANLKLDTIGHNLGVGLREFGMFEKMSPARQLKSLEDTVSKMNDQLHKEFGGIMNGKFFNKFANGTFSDIVLTDEFKQQYKKAETQEDRAKLIEDFGKEVAKSFPSTLGEKVSAWRYMMMLTNTTTWARNAGGNLLEQGIVSMKNGMYYLIEKGLQKGGYIGESNINRNDANDSKLLNYAQENALKTLQDDFAEFKQTKGVSQKDFFRQKGYSGALLNRLASFKGDNFSLSSQPKLVSDMNYNVASAMKSQGISVDSNGAAVGDMNIRQTINDSFNSANKMLMRDTGLRKVNSEGGYATGERSEIKALENYFNTDKWIQEQQGNKWFDKPTGTGLQHAFNEARRENVFGDSLPGRAANSVNHLTNYVLNDSIIGDASFSRFRFARTMGSILDAQGYSLTTAEDGTINLMKDGETLSTEDSARVLDQYKGEALQEAKESVYRNTNAIAQWINKGRRIPGLNLVLDATMPFTTTPLNIVSQAVQYSPAGILYALNDYNGLSTGQATPQQFVNHLAKTFTGTSLAAVGALIASLGWLRGTSQEPDKERKYKQQLGEQDYALVLPDGGTYSLDWGAPGITPLLIGAAVHDTLAQKSGDVELDEAFFNVLESIYQPISDTTMLEGLLNTMSAFGEDHPVREAAKTMFTSYAGQFTPTIGARINKIFDDTARSTYTDNFIENILRQSANKLVLTTLAYKQITGEDLLEPQLNVKGEEVKNIGGNALGRAAYYLLSPGTYKPNTKDSYDDELIRLFESENVRESSKNYLFPSQIYGFSGNSLDPEERTELNKYYLQSFRSQMEDYMDSPIYQEADDDTRAAMLTTLKDYYYDMTKAKYYGRVSPDSAAVLNKTQIAVSELEKLGVAPYQTLTYKRMESDKDSDGNTIKNTKALKVRNAMEMEGTYQTVLKLIEEGKIAPGDVGLNKTVIGMDRATYLDSYNSMADGTYTGLSTDSGDGTGKKSSKRSGRRSSGGRKSSGKSDLQKLYEKLFDMAMSETLGSIGDLASQMSSQAQKDYGPKSERTNHETLINELEKMVAQQRK